MKSKELIIWYNKLPKSDEALRTFLVADWFIVNEIMDCWYKKWRRNKMSMRQILKEY